MILEEHPRLRAQASVPDLLGVYRHFSAPCLRPHEEPYGGPVIGQGSQMTDGSTLRAALRVAFQPTGRRLCVCALRLCASAYDSLCASAYGVLCISAHGGLCVSAHDNE